ncbi:carbohydrate ABC transporter permease [Pseudonocardia zijingensis]|uniref:Sugar ABC transporter permease n=1 Tax=Pseudonocardia zijingensis TaxID=153376 RepID=A0ABN1N990_9PSEU
MTAGTAAPPVPQAPAAAPGPPGMQRRTREALAAYGFLSPWIAGMIVLTIGPMIYSLYLSFTRYNLMTPAQWVGVDNYVRMFTADPRYLASVGVTLRYVAISVPLLLVVSLLVAMLLSKAPEKGFGFLSGYRAAFYLPSLIASSVAIAVLWRQVFGQDGIVNEVLALVGIEGGSWIGNPGTALYTLVVLHVWSFGSTMIIFLAGLRQVPKEYYEAAAVDGAGRVRRFVHITLPMLTPLIFFNLLLSTVNAFQAFTPAYVISGGEGGPLDSTLFYTLYLYQRGFANLEMGYAAAMAWTLVVVLALFTAGLFASARFWVHYGDEK